jgi:peptidyl-prolyl cis-trans isomerase D
MIKLLSRMERTRSLIIIGFALLMGVSLVLFYAPGRGGSVTPAALAREVVARVGREEITVGDLNAVKQIYSQMFGGPLGLLQLGGDKRILDGLIRDRVIAQEAARLGLAPSDAEVADAIRRQFTDASGKFIGFERYKETVVARYGSVENFERQMRNAVAEEKLRAFVTAGVQVSEEEVLDTFKRRNTKFDLIYVPVTVDKLAQKIQPSEDELRAFYEEHKTDFRILEPQKKIRYIYIDQEKVGQRIKISDDELRAEYEKLSPENKQAGVRVQQIVLKVARPELDSTVREKADALVSKLRGPDGKASEEAFAEAARGNSEDPATARAGGYLPRPVRRNPNKPDDPLQRTLDAEEGQVIGPIKYGNAYYIFRRGAAVPKTFEEAKRELEVSLRNRKSYDAAAKLADRAVALLKETKDVQRVAQELAPEANMSPQEMVRETPYVKPGDDVPNIGVNPQFEETIAPLNEVGDVGNRVGVRGGFAIPMLADKRDPRIPDFAEVRDKVLDRVRRERARQQLEQVAREIADGAQKPEDLRTLAEKHGLQAQTSSNYTLGTPLTDVGTSAAADEAIYALQAGQVTKNPIKVSDSLVVVGVTKRTEADLAEFAKQRDTLMEEALAERRAQIFNDYIEQARARMEREGKIKIYDDVLKRAAEFDQSLSRLIEFGKLEERLV